MTAFLQPILNFISGLTGFLQNIAVPVGVVSIIVGCLILMGGPKHRDLGKGIMLYTCVGVGGVYMANNLVQAVVSGLGF